MSFPDSQRYKIIPIPRLIRLFVSLLSSGKVTAHAPYLHSTQHRATLVTWFALASEQVLSSPSTALCIAWLYLFDISLSAVFIALSPQPCHIFSSLWRFVSFLLHLITFSNYNSFSSRCYIKTTLCVSYWRWVTLLLSRKLPPSDREATFPIGRQSDVDVLRPQDTKDYRLF